MAEGDDGDDKEVGQKGMTKKFVVVEDSNLYKSHKMQISKPAKTHLPF